MADRRFTLPERIAACDLLWRLIIQTHANPKTT
jgi:hypothetical protein